MANSPFIRDVPAAQALEAWRAAREAAGCPERLPAIDVPITEAAGLVTAAPVWATRSSPPFDAAGMDGIAVRAADTLGASETTPAYLAPGGYDAVDGQNRVRFLCCLRLGSRGRLTWPGRRVGCGAWSSAAG